MSKEVLCYSNLYVCVGYSHEDICIAMLVRGRNWDILMKGLLASGLKSAELVNKCEPVWKEI